MWRPASYGHKQLTSNEKITAQLLCCSAGEDLADEGIIPSVHDPDLEGRMA